MTVPPGARTGDRGETLIELVVAVAIMGVAVVALVGGLGTAILMSDVHRKQAVAGANVRAFAEAVAASVAASPSGYVVNCADPRGPYAASFTPDAGYAAEVLVVRYLTTGNAFVDTCVGDDIGVQRVTLRVRSNDGRAVETLDVIVRKPCRPTTEFPLDAPCT
jgi:type II secretory pathway pseudopilin PulG